MKNLARVETRKKRAAGATETSWQHVKGELINLAFWMMKQGYAESTIKGTIKPLKTMIKRGLILNDPESAKEVIARQNWKNGTKSVAVEAYSRYLAMNGLTWDKPRYKPDQKLPFISTEEEIDQLIASCGLKASVFLQGLKETGADPGELANIQWTDINKQTNTITINNPVKGHNPRILQISNDLIARLELLPKHPDRVFNTARAMYSNYYPQRNRAAEKFSNPRLKKITFITLRHWKGTMEYHKTKDILHVKKILGHKNIQNTMVYINLEAALFTTRNDDFTVKVADTLEEACKLVEVGFEYVTDMDGAKIFRKRK